MNSDLPLIFRISVKNRDNNEQLQPQSSEDRKLANSGSLNSGGGIIENESDGYDEKGPNGPQLFVETGRGSVNTNEPLMANTQLGTVNTRDNSVIRSVHNRDGLNTENEFADDDEFD